ncbi:MAG: superoxide dismutase [Saprospiraceae bacterium]
MKKREFLKTSSILTVGALTVPMSSCKSGGESPQQSENTKSFTPFALPQLPYAFEALEPSIDKMTMEIHHGKHHAGYVRKLNAALESHALAGKSLDDIVSSVGPDDAAIRNNGGGHYNHSLFWEIIKPGESQMPYGKLSDAINSNFGSFEKFKEEFSTAAATRFGSGWAWLSLDSNNKLFVSSTPNQDNPLMSKLVSTPGHPILGLDVWEHAYYLKYQNKRKDYISNFFNIINWEEVARRYDALV